MRVNLGNRMDRSQWSKPRQFTFRMRSPTYITAALVIAALMAGVIVCKRREAKNLVVPTAPAPRRRVSLSSWVWTVLYLALGVAVVLALVYKSPGHPATLQIVGTLITVVGLMATIMVRTSEDSATAQLEQPFQLIPGIGALLITTGIYHGAVEELSALWQFGLGMSVIVAWLIFILLAGRAIK